MVFRPTPLKNDGVKVSWDDEIPNIWNGKLKMIETTNQYINTYVYIHSSFIQIVHTYTSSTAQGGCGSFKNRKPIGEIGCCESGMAERSHWWIERRLISLTLSLTVYLPTYLSSYVSIYLSISLSSYLSLPLSLSFDYSIYLSIDRSIYLSLSLSFICLSV